MVPKQTYKHLCLDFQGTGKYLPIKMGDVDSHDSEEKMDQRGLFIFLHSEMCSFSKGGKFINRFGGYYVDFFFVSGGGGKRGMPFFPTPWKINMEPTNHPF